MNETLVNSPATAPDKFKYRVILIFDMNSFFASVELLARPDLVGKPVIIGQLRRRRVVCTATPEARCFGVKKGMATLEAAALCRKHRPDTVWLPVRKLAYEEESDEILKVLKSEMRAMRFDPAIETVGLDEAYLDLTPYCQGGTAAESLDNAIPIAKRLKAAILNQRKLHCKIGIASNKMMAKIATDRNSPDGINIIYDHVGSTILPPLDVNEIPGVGEITEQKLKSFGFKTIADIQKAPRNIDFTKVVGNSLGSKLRNLSFGKDPRPVEPDGPPQSFSRIETFEYDTKDLDKIVPVLMVFARELEARLNKFKYEATIVKVNYRHGSENYLDEKPHSRSKKYPDRFAEWGVIIAHALNLFHSNNIGERPLYSLGISVEGFVNADEPKQIRLF